MDNNEYRVKVPVYVTGNLERIEDDLLFSPTTCDSLISEVKDVIVNYNNRGQKVAKSNRRKSSIIGVQSIMVHVCSYDEDKCLLLQATVFKTNLIDGYYKRANDSDIVEEEDGNSVFVFQQNDKLCSSTHFILLYPSVFSVENRTIIYWRVFVYEDPTKSNEEVTHVAKMIMKDILKTPIKNIKEEKLLNDLKDAKCVSNVELTFYAFNDIDDETPPYLQEYNYSGKIKKEKKYKLDNMSSEDAIKAYNDEDMGAYTKKVIKYTLPNRRVLSVSMTEFKDNIHRAIEDSFNYFFTVTGDDLNSGRIFDIDFIRTHIQAVFTNFMSLNRNE